MFSLIRRTLILLLTGLLIFGAVGAGTMGTLWHMTTEAPDFYKEAAVQAKASDPAKGEKLEEEILNLPVEPKQESSWELQLSMEEINSWLVHQMPERYPKLLPKGCKDPIVAIEDEHLLVACRYESSTFNSVVWVKVDAVMTDDQNVVAIQIEDARAGLVPLPVNQWLEDGTTRAKKAGVDVELQENEDDSVVLVRIPDEDKDYQRRRVLVDAITIQDDAITVRGRFLPSETLIGSNFSTRR